MRYTINLDCKTHYVSRDGKFPILLRVSLNGEHDYLNTGKRIKEAHYDKEKKSVKAGITGFSKLASFIDRQKLRVENIISDFDKKSTVPDFVVKENPLDKGIYVEVTVSNEKSGGKNSQRKVMEKAGLSTRYVQLTMSEIKKISDDSINLIDYIKNKISIENQI